MKRLLALLTLSISASPLFAAGYTRPVPQAQSATAEFWFALASLALVAALFAVHKIIFRK
ncbi:protein NnrT [Parasedimentitalea maritima]|uniref:Protein NnrT n=1 Tax=Parasedimentitalea maritima TaxID=2578117 RepID=A0A5R8ZR82_9RHOB|nr:protein NnrT [Zongyanglinia marina]KAE9630131.1 protein NnrT [Zongyanglinia marina]TLP68072.1 protein NnrT [Zongyanglinia marina]